MRSERKNKGFIIYISVMIALAAAGLVLSRLFPAVADLDAAWILPVSLTVLGGLASFCPVAVADILLGGTAFVFIVLIVMAVFSIFFKGSIRRATGRLAKAFAVYAATIIFLLSFNWCMLYNTTPIADREDIQKYYTADNMVAVYNLLVTEANALADTVVRDEHGVVVCDMDVNAEAKRCMESMEDEFPLLSGYYSEPKYMGMANFFSQQYVAGYYFPLTMESNINPLMDAVNLPSVTCHELAHLKGYIREDEANFLGYLGCFRSDNDVFCYSALIDTIGYFKPVIDAAIRDHAIDPTIRNIAKCDERIFSDNVFINERAWEKINEESILDTETVAKAASKVRDNSLKFNGIEDGQLSYNRVVELMIWYHCTKGKLL